ncbi:hypothetical protein FNV43_RR26147 [Rhamnella rubrinervis]|uniref:DUF1664 domain-containing protein n=1 Tax=Rhamnella rubrinervis TaxID=2594499 RepID=A0A8K0DME6_9ROSA|nr:hypothetical protein FNV43_RR26147 [Rhamnella rubrinervis]
MAVQTGIGFSKILVLAGAGYTGTILLKNNKLSDLLGELQALVKGLEKKADQAEGDAEYSDAIAAQVRRLAAEVRQLASARSITVMNGNEGYGNLSSLIVPAATLGALGYGYMWWKGIAFSDLMYVTKRNMASAVSNLTKHLESVSDALAKTKKHLTQRIQNLDDKMLEQNELSRTIKEDVAGVHQSVSGIEYDLTTLRSMVSGLDVKLCSLDYKQNVANQGVMFLCNFVHGQKVEMPEELKEQLKLPGKARGLLTHQETMTPKGLKAITDSFFEDIRPAIDANVQDGISSWKKSQETY